MVIILPFEVYNNKNLRTGIKLLWGEYNRFRDTLYGYYAKRETTANNIGCSKASISTWTNKLEAEKMIIYDTYHLRNRRTLRTVDFNKEEQLKQTLKKEASTPVIDVLDFSPVHMGTIGKKKMKKQKKQRDRIKEAMRKSNESPLEDIQDLFWSDMPD